MPLRPEDLEDLDDLPEPQRAKLPAALARVDGVRRAASQVAEAPQSLLGRLMDWLTEEVPEHPPKRYVAAGSRGHVRRFSEVVDQPVAAPDKDPDPADGPVAWTRIQLSRAAERRRDRHPSPAAPTTPPWVTGLAALALVALVAAGAGALRSTGGSTSAASGGTAVRSLSTTPAAKPSAPSSTAANTGTAPSAAAAVPAGQPDCAPMRMQPVPPASGATQQTVPGLCYTLGNGQTWEVGCANGYAVCSSVLQGLLGCLRQVGSQQHGLISEANVESCAEAQVSASGATASSSPSG